MQDGGGVGGMIEVIVTSPFTMLVEMAPAAASEATTLVRFTDTEVDAGVADTLNASVTRTPSPMTLLFVPTEAMIQRLPVRFSVLDAAIDAAPLVTPVSVRSEV